MLRLTDRRAYFKDVTFLGSTSKEIIDRLIDSLSLTELGGRYRETKPVCGTEQLTSDSGKANKIKFDQLELTERNLVPPDDRPAIHPGRNFGFFRQLSSMHQVKTESTRNASDRSSLGQRQILLLILSLMCSGNSCHESRIEHRDVSEKRFGALIGNESWFTASNSTEQRITMFLLLEASWCQALYLPTAPRTTANLFVSPSRECEVFFNVRR